MVPEETLTEKAPAAPAIDLDKSYPKGVALGAIVFSLAVSVFLCALDETIIVTAIPTITNEFKTIKDIGWYGSAYFMTFAALQLIYGKLFTFYSTKKVFLASVAIFEAGSLICATAPTSSAFVAGRACAGVGAAGINAGFIIILAASLPLARRPMFASCYSGMYGVSAVVAPLLGGFFTTKATWRWCFYINLPIGAVALITMALFFHPPPNPRAPTTWLEKLKQMDLLGTAILLPGVICLLLALQLGGSTYSWGSSTVVALLVVTAVAMLGFVAVQAWKKDLATVPPRIVRQRSVAYSAWYVFAASGAINVFQYFIPIWFQAIQGVTALDSGIRILPTTLSIALFSFVSGVGVAKLGYYTPFVIFGSAIFVAGAYLTTTWQVSSPATRWVGYQVIIGVGAGLGIQQAHTAAQTVLAAPDVPTGAVVLIFAHVMGSTITLSMAQNVFTGQLLKGVVDSGLLGLNAEVVLGTGATDLRTVVSTQYLDKVMEIYNYAVTRGPFVVAVALAASALVSSLGFEWKSVKKPPASDLEEGS